MNNNPNSTLTTAQVTSIAGWPERIQIRVVIGVRIRSLWVIVITSAVAPIGVPLPPKPAPKASAHHSADTGMPRLPSSRTTGLLRFQFIVHLFHIVLLYTIVRGWSCRWAVAVSMRWFMNGSSAEEVGKNSVAPMPAVSQSENVMATQRPLPTIPATTSRGPGQ